MKTIEAVLAGHFNGRPSEMHYGCNKRVVPKNQIKRKPKK